MATKTKFIEPITAEEFYVWVAPDGTIQPQTLAPDFVMVIAMTKMLHKKGVAQSMFEMERKGFTIERVKVTIEPLPQLDFSAIKTSY